MKLPLKIIVVMVLLWSCNPKKNVELIVVNAKVYTVDDNFSTAEAFAIQNGKFVQVGTTDEVLEAFDAPEIIDANKSTILPGLIDAHCHYYNLGRFMQKVDLIDTKSFEEVIQRVVSYQKKNKKTFIIGRGWDQNDWAEKSFPNKAKLDQLFPNTPIALERIDGHALLVNQAALNLARIDEDTKIEGGEIIKYEGEITGVLIDNAQILIENIYPKPTLQENIEALKKADQKCLSEGLTTVDDAGLNKNIIDLIDSLQLSNELKIRVYAMVSASKKNLDYYLKHGIIKTEKLNVRSFKVYADGALGSRGAAMKKTYSDRESHFGAFVTPPDSLKAIAKAIANSNFQMNTHAIGDSANAFILKTYTQALKSQTNRRWRVEHAQVIDSIDFDYFTDIIPSVQPTHATSDMYWAEDRVGSQRIGGAYAFKRLLNIKGKIILGTDFPVEKVSPMLTFYAAISRKDIAGYPEHGFETENALTREEALKGMTIWAAYGNFEENEKGNIVAGKLADFIILDQNIMEVDVEKIPHTKVINTYIHGEKVY